MQARSVWPVLSVLLLGTTAGAAEVAHVPLKNPSFEADANHDGVPDGWHCNRGSKAGRVVLDSRVKKEGRSSVRMESSRAACDWLLQAVAVEPGALYRASVWVKTENLVPGPARAGALHGTFGVKAGPLFLERGKDHGGTTEWVKEVVDFIGPRDGRVVVACLFADRRRATGTVWFDDVRLVRLAAPGGIGALADPPRGCRALAEWAVRRRPPQWQSVFAALEGYYAWTERRDHEWVAPVLERLWSAAQGDPKLRAELTAFCARHAWETPLGILEKAELRDRLRMACQQLAGDAARPEVAATARLGLARLTALGAKEATAKLAETLVKLMEGAEAQRVRLRGILLGDAWRLRQSGADARAARLYDLAVAVAPEGHWTRLDAELARARFLAATGETRAAEQAARRLIAAEREVSPKFRTDALLILVRLGVASGDPEAAAKWVAVADQQLAGDVACRAAVHAEHARALAAREQWAGAAAACQRLVASFPQRTNACFEAQKLLVQSLLKQRRFEEAVAAAKLLYGVAPNSEKEITDAVNLVMRALKAQYRSIALVNDFVAFQSHGPHGKDGKKGTEDDIEDPLAQVRYSPPAEIEALFKKTLDGLKTDFQGRRWRSYLYLYWGKSELALKELVLRYDEAPLEQKALDEAIDDLIVALKAYCGHTLAGERFMDYQKFGPKGKDGKLGTEDDLTDPLKDILAKPGPPR